MSALLAPHACMNTCVKVRVFRREEVLSEITEADRVTHLECLDATRRGAAVEGEGVVGTKWAYGLANGELLRENASPNQWACMVRTQRKDEGRESRNPERRSVGRFTISVIVFLEFRV